MIRARYLAMAAALLACGPSSSEMKAAKTARYSCEYQRILQAAVDVVKEETPPIGTVMAERGFVSSDFRWHSASGMRKKSGAADLQQGDMGLVVEVRIGKDGGGFFVQTQPRVFSQSPDSPRGQEMSHEHANWPGWADAKADTVQFKIHEKLSSCAAKGS